MYKLVIRPILFMFDPEKVHHFTFKILRLVFKLPLIGWLYNKMCTFQHPQLSREVFGLTFKNPVGLAAGFDKDAKLYKELHNLGFGFIEIGTVTPKPQEGNPKKRLFRLKADQAIINRMGFNNGGVAEAVMRLKKNENVLIGGNIGKNKTTPNEKALDDYTSCFHALFDVVDYFVVNVSSPNTPGLRKLQDKEPLTQLLKNLQLLNNEKPTPKPIVLKIAPDLSNAQLLDIIAIVSETKIAGVIASNTTIERKNLTTKGPKTKENGGLSGKPLEKRATAVIKFLHTNSNGAFPIIGVGGIHSAKDAVAKLKAGASLIQLYTGFIYEGPRLIKKINKEIIRLKL